MNVRTGYKPDTISVSGVIFGPLGDNKTYLRNYSIEGFIKLCADRARSKASGETKGL